MGTNCTKSKTDKPVERNDDDDNNNNKMWMRSAAQKSEKKNDDRVAELETKPVTPESQVEIEGKVLRPKILSFHETVALMRKNRNKRLQLILKNFKDFEQEAFDSAVASLAKKFEEKVNLPHYPVSTITLDCFIHGRQRSVPHSILAEELMKCIYNTNTAERGWLIFREKLIDKLVAYLESLGHVIQSVRICLEEPRYVMVEFVLRVKGYSKLRGLARFIIVMNRYRRDFYAPGGPGYLEAEADFAARVSASNPPTLLGRLVNSPG